jgi:hypothetical protein
MVRMVRCILLLIERGMKWPGAQIESRIASTVPIPQSQKNDFRDIFFWLSDTKSP